MMIVQSGATLSVKNDELFIQEPYEPEDSKADCRASSTKYPHVVYEDFWDLTEPIGAVRWWGQSGTYSGIWNSCNPEGMTFRIVFYEDENGVPGDMVFEYAELTPSITPTGIIYEYEGYEGIFEMNYFEVQLFPVCDISNGWISIISTGSDHGCAFLWANSPDGNKNSFQTRGGLVQLNDDFAFSLTEQYPNADLQCDDTLTWNEVQTGELVHGSFSIKNNGEVNSLLDWEIISNPVWGENWSFIPDKGFDIAPSDGEITIEVSVEAPHTEDITWNGEIKVVNSNNLEDYEIIPVTLITPKQRTINNFIMIFLEYTNWLFPIYNLLMMLS